LKKEKFEEMSIFIPEIHANMQEKTLLYDDEWIQFKIKMLQQIDYFDLHVKEDNEPFFKHVQYYMKEQSFQEGTFILRRGQVPQQVYFIVNGLIQLQVEDSIGENHVLEELRQGDIIGQYSVLFDESLMFNIVATTHVRVLTLDNNFFKLMTNGQK